MSLNNIEKKVSVLTLNWNNYPDTKKCLSSLLNLYYAGQLEIICIDNGSTDGSFVRIQEEFRGVKGIRFIQNKINLGYAGGINVGIAYVIEKESADFVWLLNNDIVVDVDSLDKLVDGMQLHPNAGMAGPTIYYDGSDRIMEQCYDLSLVRGRFMLKTNLDTNAVIEIDPNKGQRNITDAAVFFRMTTLKDLGLLPEEYFMYYEVVAWHELIKRTPWQYLYVGPSRVWHKRNASSGVKRRSYSIITIPEIFFTSWQNTIHYGYHTKFLCLV
jgi:GT2 family glycosyltransferase